MADLRGEQLKDSYQNVVTRGTGNKLENGNGVEFADLDDKASLSGANFTDMPQVDGSPIVERGSNSDREFVRFADGTQIVYIPDFEVPSTGSSSDTVQGLTVYRSSSFTVSFPVSFIDSIYSVSANLADTSSTARSSMVSSRPFSRSSGSMQVQTLSSLNSGALNSNFDYTIIGRWK